jgi:hypothetical protein
MFRGDTNHGGGLLIGVAGKVERCFIGTRTMAEKELKGGR